MVNLKGWMMILELHQRGLSVSAIAERTGHDRKTVRKVIGGGLVVPKYAVRMPRPTLLGLYETYLRERVSAWPWSGAPSFTVALKHGWVRQGCKHQVVAAQPSAVQQREDGRSDQLRVRVPHRVFRLI